METEALPTASAFPSAFAPAGEAVGPASDSLEGGGGAAANPLAGALGLADTFTDDLKEKAQAVIQPKRGAKRPKMTHGLFFEDDNGLKKVLRSFPKIRFKGKGRELDDLNLLLQHYDRWLKDLYPSDDHFEDKVQKARSVLQSKEPIEEGSSRMSDPKELLHLLRFQYKSALPDLDEPAAASGVQITDDMRKKIEENRKRALERRQQREANANPEAELDDADMFGFGFGMEEDDPAAGGFAAAAGGFDDDEDIFGFGGGLDDDDDFGQPVAKAATLVTSKADSKAGSGLNPDAARRIEENRAKALAIKKQREEAAKASKTVAEAGAAPASVAKASAPPATGMDDDEDVFGFGGGFDDDDDFGMPSAPKASEQTAGKSDQTSKELDAEKLARIEANRAKALALREQREKEKQLQNTAAQKADAVAAQAESATPMNDAPFEPEDEADIWGFGGGLDEP